MTALRLFDSPCDFIRKCMPFLRISSVICAHIKELFQKEYDIENVFENDSDAINSRIIFVQNHEETLR